MLRKKDRFAFNVQTGNYEKVEFKDNALARHIAKTITWRIIGSIDTMVVSWIITGSFKTGIAIGGVEVFTKMFLYFIHERVWYKFGKIGRKKS